MYPSIQSQSNVFDNQSISTSTYSQCGRDSISSRLHDYLDIDEIDDLYQLFQQAQNKKFNNCEFRELLLKINIHMTDEEFKTFFLRIDSNRDNHCDWDEFISYLILGFQRDDPYTQKETLRLPIERNPIVKQSYHAHPIIRILFCPTVLQDRTINNDHGNYITIAKDGTINYWTVNFDFSRSVQSKNPYLKVAKTWILDCCSLSDVQVICTSSTERDLRFYDTTANNFLLRIIISSLPYAISTLNYWFSKSSDITSKIVMGDFNGNVILLEFNTHLRGPFQSRPGSSLIQLTWQEFIQGKLPLMKITKFNSLHADIVRQVGYIEEINAIISVAECLPTSIGKIAAAGLVISYLSAQRNTIIIRANKGISCFAFDTTNFTIATGGPDTILRIWNPIKPQKPVTILAGHHAGIKFIVIQTYGKRIYSLDRNKIIKIWDMLEQNLLQTYILMGTALPDMCDVTAFYNDLTRDLFIAGMRIANVKCSALIDLSQTDGQTHSRAVSVILYNELFKTIVTCGFDSFIIVWDPWTGKRLTLIKMAHTREIHGEMKRVEITAGCFDPKLQLLLTGARDGTLKIWNFNNGVCIRNFQIESMCEVTAVFWTSDRMLTVGWNKHVTEFSDSDDNKYGDGKEWQQIHTDDILCAAIHVPHTIVTCSYAGELLFWKLETGQPYKRFDVEIPETKQRIISDNNAQKMHYLLEKRYDTSIKKPSTALKYDDTEKVKTRQLSIIQMPTKSALMQPLAIHSTIFLDTRSMSPDTGTVFVALSNGFIQVYSHHNLGGYLNVFNAIHMAGDCVTFMQTDKENNYLFTGHALGYIKTWHIVNYCIPETSKVHVNIPALRLKFPFLIRDQWEGRAKRSVRGQLNPLLLNSYKAHIKPINGLIYINEAQILVSASSDNSVRLWTISGRYIGTLGSPVRYESFNEELNNNYKFRIPPDIQRITSSTTLKVFNGGRKENQFDILREKKKQESEDGNNDNKLQLNDLRNICEHGEPLKEPILGKHFKLPARGIAQSKPVLDLSLPYIPVYSHLEYHSIRDIKRPISPIVLSKANTKNLSTNDVWYPNTVALLFDSLKSDNVRFTYKPLENLKQ